MRKGSGSRVMTKGEGGWRNQGKMAEASFHPSIDKIAMSSFLSDREEGDGGRGCTQRRVLLPLPFDLLFVQKWENVFTG